DSPNSPNSPDSPDSPDSPGPPRWTRFAPSPTGYLHLGHVAHAVYVWGVARTLGARVLLRLETHDRIRCRPEYAAAWLEDLAWLGFTPDDGPVTQDDDTPYADALERLTRAGLVYACDCSRTTLARDSTPGEEARYAGRCRTRGLAPHPGRTLRVIVEPGEESFIDLLAGPRRQAPAAQCGDLALRNRDGLWTYQFAVTVDDLRQEIDLVIRGADLLPSTGRQLRLARLLGRTEPPLFLHHPLIRTTRGDKLSKTQGDTGVRELRAAGRSPAEVIGLACHAVGLCGTAAPIDASHAPRLVHVPTPGDSRTSPR
ncbi:MAG: tRNA glutamyl-Q(34) synthetase GluQRS, partial [Acidimicrobiia bacterium]|nr:tRNA glutamyl-Q(34) synthetase GluQRS [Acidimicrobiia bacterium]